jgi:hypothetical protein
VKQQSESLQIEVASTTNEVSRQHFLERACAWTLELLQQLLASSFLIWSHAATTLPRVPSAINISPVPFHLIDQTLESDTRGIKHR